MNAEMYAGSNLPRPPRMTRYPSPETVKTVKTVETAPPGMTLGDLLPGDPGYYSIATGYRRVLRNQFNLTKKEAAALVYQITQVGLEPAILAYCQAQEAAFGTPITTQNGDIS